MLFAKPRILLILATLAALAAHASAEDVMQKAVSSPDRFWAPWGVSANNFVSARQLKGGAAQRVTISPKPGKPWDAGVHTTTTKPVKKGDVLLLMFWARVEKMPAGGDLVVASGRIFETDSSVNISPETTFVFGRQWRPYYASGTASRDYPPGAIKAALILGTGEQIIDLGPGVVLDFGPNYNLSYLPHN